MDSRADRDDGVNTILDAHAAATTTLQGKNANGEFWSRPGVAEVVLCATTFVVYVATLAFGFVYDDRGQIVNNPAIKAWGYIPRYFTSSVRPEIHTGAAGDYYRPLFLLWLRINDAIFGLSPRGWHFMTVACHVLVAYLVFHLAVLLAQDRRTGFLAGLLFALNPIHIESVAWISGVTDPLMAAPFLLSLIAYLHYRGKGEKRWLAVALGAFLLALLAKETAVVLPFIVICWEWPGRQGSARTPPVGADSSWQKAAALYLALDGGYLLARKLAGVGYGAVAVSWTAMIMTWPKMLVFYARHLLWPFGLSEFYLWSTATVHGFVAGLATLLGLAGGLFLLLRWLDWSAAALSALALLVLPILPALYLPGLTVGDMLHDRYLYLPCAGFALLGALALERLGSTAIPRRRLVSWMLAGILLAGYAGGTVLQQFQWASDRLLYTHGLKSAPENDAVRDNLASTLAESGEYDRAVPLYLQVLRRDPSFWHSNYNLAYLYYRTEQYAPAEDYFKRAIRIDASYADEFLYLAVVQLHEGKLDEAIVNARRAVQLNPKGEGYHYTLGVLLEAKGLKRQAADQLALELAHNPGNAQAAQQLRTIEQR